MSHEDEGTLAPTVTPQPRRLGAEGPVEAVPTAATERYVMDRELGQGGQSVVFAAKDQALGREVAFQTARRRGDEASTFVREARLTGQLEHPGIVPVHELGREKRSRGLAAWVKPSSSIRRAPGC